MKSHDRCYKNDEVNAIMFSQNELNNGYLSTIQLVNILGNLFYRKIFTPPEISILVLDTTLIQLLLYDCH